MEMLLNGNSKAKVRKILNNDYFVIPKKAALATDIARREQKIMGTPDIRDCSIYISIPFCPSRCSYCSFVSYTTPKLLSLIPDYLEKLMGELSAVLDTVNELNLHLKTIYIGGGTPTILSAEQLEKLLSLIDSKTDVSALEEFTLEGGRPDTITAEKLAVAYNYGITRISVNPQSLNEQVVKSIGRNHTTEEFYKAFEIAKQSGIKCINTDLIAGLPGDNFKHFSATFDKIIALEPENITVHTFCVKKAADILAQNQNIYSIRGGDAGKCVDYSQLRAQAAGYVPYYMYRQKNTVGNYENVGFAQEGTEGLYNIYMMEEVHSILAVGAGAVTKLVEYYPANIASTKIIRHFNPKYPYEYLENNTGEQVIDEIKKFYESH
jgi:oxygen-independent coproporphyrinogen-3 oxidase